MLIVFLVRLPEFPVLASLQSGAQMRGQANSSPLAMSSGTKTKYDDDAQFVDFDRGDAFEMPGKNSIILIIIISNDIPKAGNIQC